MTAATAIAAAPPATAALDFPAFKAALVNTCKVTERRNPVPALGAAYIRASKRGIEVIGTDCDMYATTFVPGHVSPDFTALVDAHRLKATLDKVKDGSTIKLTREDDRLIAVIGRLNLTLGQSIEETDFPMTQDFRDALGKSSCSFILRSDRLFTALQRVSFAISTEETRYYLNGVFMQVSQYRERLTFVACDGHRLARYDLEIPPGAAAMPEAGVIIPRKTAVELCRLVGRKGCPAETLVTVTKTGISFLIGEDELLESKLIDGTFPDYERVCPERNPYRVGVSKARLIESIDQVSAIRDEHSRAVLLSFEPRLLTISCTNTSFGRASTDLPVISNFEVAIGLNAAYLRHILVQLEGGAMFELADPGAPIMIRDGADDSASYTLMPMRV